MTDLDSALEHGRPAADETGWGWPGPVCPTHLGGHETTPGVGARSQPRRYAGSMTGVLSGRDGTNG
jgi:hypothetical protein